MMKLSGMQMSKFRLSLILGFVVVLAGCGGGGSTSPGTVTPVTYADGLGVSGVAAGNNRGQTTVSE
jgi:hypothetical protein